MLLSIFVIFLSAIIIILLAFGVFTIIEDHFKHHHISHYIFTESYVKNGKINFLSDLRFCKTHNCYEQQDILNVHKWSRCHLDNEPVQWKNFYFTDKEALKQFKKLKKKFPINYDENNYRHYQ